MPYDGLSAYQIANELNKRLRGTKIHKIYQPSKYELVLHFSDKEKSTLLISCDPSFPRINTVEKGFDNPQEPPAFCMLARKYLLGAEVKTVETLGFDRVMRIETENLSSASELLMMDIYCEIMGHHSNVIIVNKSNNTVVDSVIRVSEKKSSVRQVLPGAEYTLPPNNKQNPLDEDYHTAQSIISTMPDKSVKNCLVEAFCGVSNQLAESFIMSNRQYLGSVRGLNEEDYRLLPQRFADHIKDIIKKPEGYVYVDENGKYVDFSCGLYLTQREELKAVKFASCNEAAENFYKEKTVKSNINERYTAIIKKLETILAREKNKLNVRKNELSKAENNEEYNIKGNLLLSNIGSISKGEKNITVSNYYSPEQEEIKIELSPALTPSQNAQKYFKKYVKLRNAKKYLNELIVENENEVFFLSSQIMYLKNSSDTNEAEEIISELARAGKLKIKKTVPIDKKKVNKPRKFITGDGYSVLVGKNDKQNDNLTFKTADGNDLWFHVKHNHGSHVILRLENKKDFTDSAMRKAAELAAYYSEMRDERNVEVDYTPVKNVKKIPNAPAGRVIYNDYKTLVVTAESDIINKTLAEQ